MRVLMVGIAQAYHLEPLARCIRLAEPTIELGSLGLSCPNSEGVDEYCEESEEFDFLCRLPGETKLKGASRKDKQKPKQSKGAGIRFWLSGLRIQWAMVKAFRQARKGRAFAEQLFEKTDVVHLQGLFLREASYWLLLGNDKPLVISCWGSDVLRSSRPEVLLFQKKLLEIADVITITGTEFREALLAKYGRHLAPKCVETYFNPDVDRLFQDGEEGGFGEDKGSGPSLWRVCIGHNGFEENQHLPIIESFTQLPDELKSQIELIVPMTYGAKPDYLEAVKAKLASCGCKFRVLEQFMSDEEVRQFRRNTEILVFAPVSDAFSATVTQALAVGSAVITGSWLPYKTRKLTGFMYHEIQDAAGAGEKVGEVIANWGGERAARSRNRELAQQLFSERSIGKGWVDCYRKALGSVSQQVPVK